MPARRGKLLRDVRTWSAGKDAAARAICYAHRITQLAFEMNLFTYGTLMFPEVWQRIGVGDFSSIPATLPGFAIFRVRDAVFPGIVRAQPHDQWLFKLGTLGFENDDKRAAALATWKRWRVSE